MRLIPALADRLRHHGIQHSLSLWLLTLLLLHPVSAHEVRPAVVQVTATSPTTVQLAIRLNLEALLAGVGAEHEDTDDSPQAARYNQLRLLTSQQLATTFRQAEQALLTPIDLADPTQSLTLTVSDLAIPPVGETTLARDSVLTLQATLADPTQPLRWQWPEHWGASVLRVDDDTGQELYTAYLSAGQRSEPFQLTSKTERSQWQVISDYVVIGFEHILPKGMDHILFVVGLFLLSSSFTVLLWQISSFTLAHTVTLALGMLGWVSVSPTIVEPLIAASIVYVCVENLYSDQLSRWRPWVIFAFGLLHGLGFASVLTDVGLAREHFASGLIAFNIGVELGQLTVIALCLLAVGWFRQRDWYRQRISMPASVVIALIAAYWFIERVSS